MLHKIKGNKNYILIFACIATALVTVDLACISVALPKMVGYFSASKIEIAWVITVYSISTAICIPLLGYLSQKIGRKKIYLIGIFGFSIFSALSGLSHNLDQLLVFRTFQGIFSAPLVALSQSIIINAFPNKERGRAISWWTLGLLIGPLIGPTLGGYFTEYYNWRWVFLINVPIGIIAFVGSYFSLVNNKTNKNIKFAFLSFIFLAIGASSMQIVLDRGQILDWFASNLITNLTIISSFFISLFFLQYYLKSKTLFPKELFIDSNYIGGLIFVFLFGLLLVPPFILMPDFLSSLGGYPIDKIGIILTTSGLGGMTGTIIASRILSYGYFKSIMVIGLLAYMVGQYYMTAWNAEVTMQMMMINGILRGIGIGLFYPALATITYVTLPAKYRDHGASLFQFIRNAGSAVAIAIIVILMDRFNKINMSELSSRVKDTYNKNEGMLNNYNIYPLTPNDTYLYLNIITQESHLISFINIMVILTFLPLIFFPFFLLFKK
jgi:MFS transporter, DHA2 family, multidrug resistance protein